MSVLDFFRSEPVRIGLKAGFLGAVLYARRVISSGAKSSLVALIPNAIAW